MKLENIIGKDYQIYCPTKEIWDTILKIIREKDPDYYSGFFNIFDNHKENYLNFTYFTILSRSHIILDYCTPITYQDFINANTLQNFPDSGQMIVTPEQSKILQEKLLSLGFTFGTEKNYILKYFDHKYVSWDKGNAFRHFESFLYDAKQYTFEELFSNNQINIKQDELQTENSATTRQSTTGSTIIRGFCGNGKITSSKRLSGNKATFEGIRGGIKESKFSSTILSC